MIRYKSGKRAPSRFSIPFRKVVKLPAWRVTFKGVKIVGVSDGTKTANPNIRQLTVLIDARKGALLEVLSPRPATAGFDLMIYKNRMDTGNVVLAATTSPPRVSLTQAVGKVEPWVPVSAARQIVAYYGRATDPNWREKFSGKPVWMIFVNGFSMRCPSGPIGNNNENIAHEARVIVNAKTGRCETTELVGRSRPLK